LSAQNLDTDPKSTGKEFHTCMAHSENSFTTLLMISVSVNSSKSQLVEYKIKLLAVALGLFDGNGSAIFRVDHVTS